MAVRTESAHLSPERKGETRRAACRALARMKVPATAQTLTAVLADLGSPPAVRAMAADSLGRLGRHCNASGRLAIHAPTPSSAQARAKSVAD